ALAHGGDVGHRVFADDELLRIGAAVGPHGAGFAAPDELGARQAEAAPAAFGVLGRVAVALAVPAFHRMHGEAVADRHAVDLDRRAERRLRPVRDNVVARHVEPERGDVITKSGDAVERACLGIIAELHNLPPNLFFASGALAHRDVGPDDVDAMLPAVVALLFAEELPAEGDRERCGVG